MENRANKVDDNAEIHGRRVGGHFGHGPGIHIWFGGRPHHPHPYGGPGGIYKPMSPVGQFFFCLLFALIGGVCLFFGIKMTTNNYSDYVSVAGKVIDYNESWDYDTGTMYAPIYEYYVEDDRYILESTSSSNMPDAIGTTKEILYDPKDPTKAVIKSEENTLKIVLLVIGGLFTLAGTIGCVSALTKKTKEA